MSKRAKHPGRCINCGQHIKDREFLRDRKGDQHLNACPPPQGTFYEETLRHFGGGVPRKEAV